MKKFFMLLSFICITCMVWGQNANELMQKAQNGNAKAQYQLGKMYQYGSNGLNKNASEAIKWITKAAENKHAEANQQLGLWYTYGFNNIEKNYNEAEKWWLRAAELGDCDSQAIIGEWYYRGEYTTKNSSKAIYWFKKYMDTYYKKNGKEDKQIAEYLRELGVHYHPSDNSSSSTVSCSSSEKLLSSSSGKINGHEYMDIGLSVKWATCNLGADSPIQKGKDYPWADTTEAIFFADGKNVTKDISGNAKYDAARAEWKGSWRLPTLAEIKELKERCKWKRTTINGKTGCLVTGPNGNSIFLPAQGIYLYGVNEESVYYWSSTPFNSEQAYCLYFIDNDNFGYEHRKHIGGMPIRPVSK